MFIEHFSSNRPALQLVQFFNHWKEAHAERFVVISVMAQSKVVAIFLHRYAIIVKQVFLRQHTFQHAWFGKEEWIGLAGWWRMTQHLFHNFSAQLLEENACPIGSNEGSVGLENAINFSKGFVLVFWKHNSIAARDSIKGIARKLVQILHVGDLERKIGHCNAGSILFGHVNHVLIIISCNNLCMGHCLCQHGGGFTGTTRNVQNVGAWACCS
mmetsp:Transcript_28273/g.46815  ORF Transcript_28273/g.46815 Transcript_28273/m.46815 type:complete len:213 (-) Transcript_28273:169-807(-)